jgi:signal transduction histidine kinase/AmiR/NasT family two-component response regulator
VPTPSIALGYAAGFRAWDGLRRPIWVFDPATCRGLYANPPAMELWGAETLDELLSRDFSKLSPAVLTRVARLAQATADGGSVTERWSFYPKGQPLTVQAVISTLKLEDGRPALLFEAAPADVEAEELRAVEALRHTAILITLFDASGRAAFANPAAFAAYGEAGNTFAARFDDPDRAVAALTGVLAGAVLDELRQTPSTDGEGRWRHLDARLVTDPATGMAGVLVSERDVTAQIEAERAAAAAHERAEVAEAKQRFLANISHELRTPLNAITGFAGLLAASPLDAGQSRHLARIGEAGEHLTRILNDVIDLAELDRHEVRLDRAAFAPADLLAIALEAVRPAADAKGLALNLEAPTPALHPMIGDAGKLAKVVSHFVDNAVKFTARGAVTLRLDAQGDALTISVIDTGPGLDAATQARLFRPFSQGDDGMQRSAGGSGLGLAIARELMALMGGEVGVESTPGKGSRFWLRVALAPAETPASDGARADDDDDRPFSILYADDNEANRALVQAILASQGLACDLVEDGAQAVEAVRGGDYDLVLMDIQMPVMDGVTATREIRRLAAPQGGIPILALTANTLSEQRETYADAGMADCIAKPVNIGEVLAKTLLWAAAGREQRAAGRVLADVAARA